MSEPSFDTLATSSMNFFSQFVPKKEIKEHLQFKKISSSN